MKPNNATRQYELDDFDNAVLDLRPERTTWPYDQSQELLEVVSVASDRVDDMDRSFTGPGPSLEYAQHQHARYLARITDIKFLLAENGVLPQPPQN